MTGDNFQIMSARLHVRKRTGMYLGSTSLESAERFVLGKWRSVKYVPALVKMVDEILDNAIDESIRTNFKFANEIRVTIKKDSVTVTDNGRGIPHDEIVDHETGETILRPVAAWTKIRAGTSFDDDRVTIGANGVGSACVNFMSRLFKGQTWSNGKLIEVRCENGAEKVSVFDSKKKDGHGTQVEFFPDFSLLGVDSLEEGDHIDLIHDRITSLQIAFPEIKFKINGRLVKATNLKQYAEMYANSGSVVSFQKKNVALIFASSSDGFRQTGFINGVNTRLGGSYNDYVINGIADEMIKLIKRKYKIDVNKSTVKNGLVFILFARNFPDPQYDSQTKERLTSPVSSVKKHYDEAGAPKFDVITKKIMSCSDIIEPIVEAQLAKKAAAEKRAATLAQKKLKRVKVQKHVAANTKDATLFLCEGDSAMGFLIKVRNPDTVGGYPLRGVVMNTYEKSPAAILKNKELSELIAILGLDINDPDSVDNLTYEKIAILTDADHDGHHISGLLLAFFHRFWPRLFEEERVVLTRTPIMISSKGTNVKWFYSYDDAKKFKNESKGWYHRYIKGLASLTEMEYSKIINQPVFDVVTIDKPEWFQVMFGQDTEHRKQWIKNKTPDLITSSS